MNPSIKSESCVPTSDSQIAKMPESIETRSGGRGILKYLRLSVLLCLAGCATLSDRPDPIREQIRISQNLAKKLGGTVGVDANGASITSCLAGEIPADMLPELESKNSEGLQGSEKDDSASAPLERDSKGNPKKWITCLRSIIKGQTQPAEQLTEAANIEEAKSRLLQKLGTDKEGLQVNGSLILLAEGDTADEAQIEARRRVPDGYDWVSLHSNKTRDGKFAAIVKAVKSFKKAQPREPQQVTVDPDDIQISDQPHTPQDVANIATRYVKENKGRIISCYERELKRLPDLNGKLIFRLDISSNGNVTRVTFPKEGKTIDNAAIESCISRITKVWTFPSGEKSRMVEFPLVFQGR